jgi:hypothetical protein
VIEDIDCTINLQNREEDEEVGDNGHNKVCISLSIYDLLLSLGI